MSYSTALTERLIQILFKLVRRPYSRWELAREFSVDPKTITRHINVLSLEFPIIEEKRGREIYFGYPQDFKFQTPAFSPEEIAVLLLAQKSIAGIGILAKGSFYGEQSASVLEKIRSSLPNSIKEQLDALAEVYGSAQIPEKDFSAHTETIEKLASCAVRRRKIEINYHGLGSGRKSKRTIHPLAVYFDPDGATVKLIAFDPKYRQPRVFSIDRINFYRELDEQFTRPADFTLKNYLEENCFNGIHGKPLKVRLKARGITARIFAERKFHPSQKIIERIQKSGAEEITIELTVAEGRGLERFILSYLPDIEVVEPEHLREKICEILLASLPEDNTKELSAKM